MRTERSQKPERSGCPPPTARAVSAANPGPTRNASERNVSARTTARRRRSASRLVRVGIEGSADDLSILANRLLHAQVMRAVARRPALHRDALTHLEAISGPATPHQDRGGIGLCR